MTDRWSLYHIVQTLTATGYIIKIWTKQPCHLFMRWSTKEPQEHIIPRTARGLALPSDKRFCFVAYEDNEQEEAGDTYDHTFVKEPWPSCETRWFYFHGTMAGTPSPSTSAIFKKHRYAPLIIDLYSDPHPETTSVDGQAFRNALVDGSWADAHDGPGEGAFDSISYIEIHISHNRYWNRYFINRGFLLFDASQYLSHKLISAKLAIWVYLKTNDIPLDPNIFSLNVFRSYPDANTQIQAQDYQSLDSIPLSAPVFYPDWGLNTFDLNATGLLVIQAQLNLDGIIKLAIREAGYDAPNIHPPAGWGPSYCHFYSADKGIAYRPVLTLTLEA